MSKKEIIEISAKYNILRTTIIEWKDKLIHECFDVFLPAYEKDKKIKQRSFIKE